MPFKRLGTNNLNAGKDFFLLARQSWQVLGRVPANSQESGRNDDSSRTGGNRFRHTRSKVRLGNLKKGSGRGNAGLPCDLSGETGYRCVRFRQARAVRENNDCGCWIGS
jgi:hypothetical protein